MRLPFRSSVLKVLALAVPALILAHAADAQVYKYRDPASGKIILSDNPPPGGSTRLNSQSRSDSQDDESAEEARATEKIKPSGVDPRLEARKREEEARERAKVEEENAKLEERKRQACADIQRNLKTLESGQRIVQLNDAGEREFMTDSARSGEIERLRNELSSCQ